MSQRIRGLALVVSLSHAATSFAAPSSLEKAERHFQQLDYELAVQAAKRALSSAAPPTLGTDVRKRALALLGAALVILNRKDEAVSTFDQLFELDPDFELPVETSPRVLAVFRPAHARWQVEQEEKLAMALGPGVASLRLSFAPPRSARGGAPLVLTVELSDPGAFSDQLVLAYRRSGDRSYSTLTARARPGVHELTLPATVTASRSNFHLELHLRVLHRSGATLRRVGDAEHPLSIAVSAGTARPLVKQWWLWTSLILATAAIVVVPTVTVEMTRDVGPQTVSFIRGP